MTIRSYIFPFLLALVLHVLAIGALMIGFEPEASERKLIKPQIVTSKLIVLQPKSVARPAAPPPVVTPKPQPAPDTSAQQAAASAAADKAARDKAELARKLSEQEAAEKQRVEEEIARQQRLAELATASFDDALAEEVSSMDEANAEQVAASFRQLIYQRIVSNWSRPPSARNGMQALLRVELVPTGDVVAVTVVESSGNAAFDRSAEAAVRKARKFEVPKESAAFEKFFRRFTVLFKPEDLLR